MEITTASPREIDEALAEIWTRAYAVQDKIARHDSYIKDMKDGLAKFEAGDRSYSSFTQESLDCLLSERVVLFGQHRDILRETTPFETEFLRRGRWTRFFLVKNNGGHIHSSMSCSTCFPTTQFGWLPSVSGKTEAEAVAEYGAILCTVCYPSAPTEYTDRHDDSVCSGSGKRYDSSQPSRTGFYTGNWGVCTGCGERQTITKTGNIRKHKKGA